MEEQDDQGDEGQRGGTGDARRRDLGEGLCVFEHPVLLLSQSLSGQLRTNQVPDGLIVFIQPIKLQREETASIKLYTAGMLIQLLSLSDATGNGVNSIPLAICQCSCLRHTYIPVTCGASC